MSQHTNSQARRDRLMIGPSATLTGMRAMALLVSLVLAAGAGLLVVPNALGSVPNLVIGASLLWLACHWLRIYRRPRAAAPWDLAEGALLVLIGIVLGEMGGLAWLLYLGLLYAGLAFRSLTGQGRRVLISLLVSYLAYLTVMLLVGGLLDGHLATQVLVSLSGLSIVAGLASLLVRRLTQFERSLAGQHILLEAGAALMSATDRDSVAEIAAAAARALTPEPASARAWLVAGSLLDWVAKDADGLVAVLDPAAIDAATRARLATGQPIILTGAALVPADPGLDLARTGELRLMPLSVSGDDAVVLVLASPAALSSQGVETLALLVRQVGLALEQIGLTDELRQREAVYRSLIQHASDAIIVTGEDTKILYQTAAVEQLLGVAAQQLVGLKLVDLIHPDDRGRAIRVLRILMEQPGASVPVEWRWRCGDGSWLPVESVAANRLHDDHVQGIVLTSRDISRHKALEAQLRHQAYHDSLTGLTNRARFNQRLQQVLARANEHDREVAILFLDLDRFKRINDTLGHEAGDTLLRAVADRLRACTRSDEIVARLGGDEFAVLATDLVSLAPATRLAERILAEMEEPVMLGREEIVITASIGIVVGRPGRDRAEDLLQHADVAMYEAKRQGKARYAVFRPDLTAGAMERLGLENDLRGALKRGELEVFYQPLINLASGRVVEVEALVRWRHPVRGLLGPGEFVPLAEETGLILPLGHWVLWTASRQVQAWQGEHPHLPSLRLGVNLSTRELQQPGLAEDIARITGRAGLDMRQLRLEVTETAAMGDLSASVSTLNLLRDGGARVAIDDFGTGHSTLSRLKDLPIDGLKIDRAFIAGLGQDVGDMAIVRAVLTFAKTMGLEVTAEGIETAEQLAQLQELTCDLGQGFHFSKPVPWPVVRQLLSPPEDGDTRRFSA